MPSGTVMSFNPTKGYGFIQPDGGGARTYSSISRPSRSTALPRATRSTVDQALKSSSAGAPPDGCAYRDSREPVSSPCSACNAPTHGWASPSAGGTKSARGGNEEHLPFYRSFIPKYSIAMKRAMTTATMTAALTTASADRPVPLSASRKTYATTPPSPMARRIVSVGL